VEESFIWIDDINRVTALFNPRGYLFLMEQWSIEVEKEKMKFSAAHFLIFPDGSAECLHGHNYRVFTKINAPLSEFGLVLDFNKVKPVIQELCDELDEQWLIPGEHHELTANLRGDNIWEVRYRERYYAAPDDDVSVLPICNVSVENLAALLGRRLRQRLSERYPDCELLGMYVAVEETPGQCGVYRWSTC